MNPNHVVFYNADQRFRRFVRDGRGDHSYFLTLDPPAMDELVGARFAAVHTLRDASLHLGIRLLVHRLRAGHADALAVEETVHGVLGDAVHGVPGGVPDPAGAGIHVRRIAAWRTMRRRTPGDEGGRARDPARACAGAARLPVPSSCACSGVRPG